MKEIHASVVLCKLIQAKNKGKRGSDAFDLDSVKGRSSLQRGLPSLHFNQQKSWGLAHIKGHTKRVIVMLEPPSHPYACMKA